MLSCLCHAKNVKPSHVGRLAFDKFVEYIKLVPTHPLLQLPGPRQLSTSGSSGWAQCCPNPQIAGQWSPPKAAKWYMTKQPKSEAQTQTHQTHKMTQKLTGWWCSLLVLLCFGHFQESPLHWNCPPFTITAPCSQIAEFPWQSWKQIRNKPC